MHPSHLQTENHLFLRCQLRWVRVSLPCRHLEIHFSRRRRSAFPKFRSWHRLSFIHMVSCSNFKRINEDSFKHPHVASNCFRYCCCQFRRMSFRRCRASVCCPACVSMLVFASGQQRGCQFLNVGYLSCPSLIQSVLPSLLCCKTWWCWTWLPTSIG